MQSKSETVAVYLQEVPEKRKAALAQLRQLCMEKIGGV